MSGTRTKSKKKPPSRTARRRSKQFGLPFDAHAVMVAIKDAADSANKVDLKRKEAARSALLSFEDDARPKSAVR